MTTQEVEEARPKGLRPGQYEKRLIIVVTVVAVVCTLLYVYRRTPASFTCLRGCESAKQQWVYPVAGDDVAAKMSRFHMGSERPTPLGDFVLAVLPYVPLGPPSLFLMIVLLYFLHGTRYFRRIPWVQSVMAWCGKRIDPLWRLLRLDTFHGKLSEARALHQKESEVRKRWVKQLAIAVGSLFVAVSGYLAVKLFESPWAAASAALIGSVAVVLFLYFTLNYSLPKIGEVRASHKVRAVVFALAGYAAAVLLVSDSMSLFHSQKNGPMRPRRTLQDIITRPPPPERAALSSLEHTKLAATADALRNFDPADDSTAAVVRDAAYSLLDEFERGAPTLISTNLCRASWCVALTACCLGIWVRRPSQFISQTLSGLYVLSAYLAIGVIFGLIYYDYYLREITAYNLVLDTFGREERIQELSHVLAPTEAWTDDDLKQIAWKLNDPHYQNSIEDGFFAASVFAQDRPRMSVDSAGPTHSPVRFAASFQFAFDSSEIRPQTEQACVVQDGFSCAKSISESRDVRKSEEHRKCVDGVLASIGPPGDRAWRIGHPGTNAETLCRMTDFLCGETSTKDHQSHRGYVIDYRAGADCSGTETRNDDLVRRRKQATARLFNDVLGRVHLLERKDRNPRVLERLHQAGHLDNPVPYIQDAGCDESPDFKSLWPARAECKPLSEKKGAPNHWRAAGVTIRLVEIDSARSAQVSSGLSSDTTLSDMIYFSFVSFTTTGYGDIKPVSGPVRLCVILENILEIIFTAFFFAAVQTSDAASLTTGVDEL